MSDFKNSWLRTTLAVTLLGSSLTLQANVDAGASLGAGLTPMGAERAGNADGSIPAWTGKWRGAPPQVKFAGPGTPYPDPYADEKPLFVIDAKNMEQYAANLTDGQKALLKRYPSTFRIPVYPSHRDFRVDPDTEAAISRNAQHAKLSSDGNDAIDAFGASPFPVPKNGNELILNHNMQARAVTEEANYNQVVVYADNNRVLEKVNYKIYSLWSDPKQSAQSAKGVFTDFLLTTLEPVRKKGEIIVGHEFVDAAAQPRQAWQYTPGQRRVRRAPTVGYDSPTGAGGFRVYDEDRLFNGATDRYDWSIVGKREIYIPYNNYKIDSPQVSQAEIINAAGHVNPDLMRYEKHRVWVLQATLKPNARHIYAKRMFYIDEDSWAATLADNYDGRGQLWRTNMQTSVYAFDIQRFHARLGIYHDLIAGSYMVDRLLDGQKPALLNASNFGADEFTPGNLRKLGTR
ncbi:MULTISPECIES: DUF1329 domain-containing protein [unclassified Pseudomonas]|uniref:DUF1329 domain-containing protein n=1 Tax=unclassified Pseudomonas TaxID=196821 RepID=UPI00244CFE39|nr:MULTISPECIES: DUF1329 domain-containing protein [unclassified Pseudomonas]MDH0301693.1 DUF1329 domain-containing protein [Pseudomonas sp. GD04091]MDH1984912.1 DUF1329 domain-containing protein [Pseudomonas sp. GD03689]